MAKVRGPILSMRARGQIAGSQVYATWRGVPYARQYTEPSNPQTGQQMLTRNAFRWLQDAYRYAPPILLDVWRAAAEGRPMTDRNLWTSANLPHFREAEQISNLITSPGARGGPSLASFALESGPETGQITVNFGAPDLPSGWSVAAGHVLALRPQDPHGLFQGPWHVATEEPEEPFSVTLSGLEGGQTYVVTAFVEYQRPDGRQAFSASLVGEQAAYAT